MHPSLCWLIIHARLINAAQKTEWDQNNGCAWAFLLSLPSPTWLPPAGISAMGRDDSWNRARANVQAATSRPKQDWKVRGHEPPHTFPVCLCVCPTVRWKVYPAFQAFFRRSSSLSGLGWDFVSESTCLSWEAHSWEGDGAWVCVHVGGGMLTFRWRLDQEEVEGGVDEWHEGLHTHAWTWMKSNIEDKVDCSMGTRIILALVSELILMTSIKLLLVIQFKVWRGS